MKKLQLADYKNQRLIDVRSQHDYQKGHLKPSLNLNPGNFKKYVSYYVDTDEPILFIIGEENPEMLEELSEHVKSLNFSKAEGYLLAEELPKEKLESLPTISVDTFQQLEEDYILLDVRHPDEITRPAPEKNLKNIPFEDLIDKTQTLSKNKTIYTLCGSGNRSTAAASYLKNQGFDTAVIEGGMKAVQEKSNE